MYKCYMIRRKTRNILHPRRQQRREGKTQGNGGVKKLHYYQCFFTDYNKNEKALGETQTLYAGCSKADPNFLAPLQTLSRGAGWPKFNQLEMVTTFTYRPSLVKVDAHSFELSW